MIVEYFKADHWYRIEVVKIYYVFFNLNIYTCIFSTCLLTEY